jgi:Ribbon-helix-helix protein, copG family
VKLSTVNKNDMPPTLKPESPPNAKRMSVSLTGDIVELLEFLAEKQGITQNEAIRRAIATDVYFLKERSAGGTVLIQKPDKELREVVFR